uniref:Uncharacterized protein n=1 Tax=Trichobilharzia regenti TaxID=157069 RepID=A0AA85J2L3_TRIRE|nr:unnamed protein product [Trichobilharzia regenti]
MSLSLRPREGTFKEYITWVGIDVTYLIIIMLAVMIIISNISILQEYFCKNIVVILGIVLFAAALFVFTFGLKIIQENFWYSHIDYGLIVLLISIAYCCVFGRFYALFIFIILNVSLAIAAAVMIIAVNLKRLDLPATPIHPSLRSACSILYSTHACEALDIPKLRQTSRQNSLHFSDSPTEEAVSELCLCIGSMLGLFLLGNTVRDCVGSKHSFCFAMCQAFFFWIFITLLFSGIYMLILPSKKKEGNRD